MNRAPERKGSQFKGKPKSSDVPRFKSTSVFTTPYVWPDDRKREYEINELPRNYTQIETNQLKQGLIVVRDQFGVFYTDFKTIETKAAQGKARDHKMMKPAD